MTESDIKTALAGYHPRTGHQNHPTVLHALAEVEKDPRLQAWLQEKIQLDNELRKQLDRHHPTPATKAHLLQLMSEAPADEEAKSEAEETSEYPAKNSPPHNIRTEPSLHIKAWQIAASLFLIASLALTIGYQNAQQGQQNRLSDYHQAMSQQAHQAADHKTMVTTLQQGTQWLSEHQAPTLSSLPDSLKHLSLIGCHHLHWQQHSVGFLCFLNEDQEMVHLLILPKAPLESNHLLQELLPPMQYDAPLANLPSYGREMGDHYLMLVGHTPQTRLPQI